MERNNSTVIDEERCIGCGECVAVCPAGTLAIVDGKAKIVGDHSLGCDHCAAICPTGAISVGFVDPKALKFATLPSDDNWLEFGEYDASRLVQLMRSRRSTRRFKSEPVPAELLEDLVKIGITAPSGKNAQLWNFTIVKEREAIQTLGHQIMAYYKKVNGWTKNPLYRILSKLFMRDVLGYYYRNYYQRMKQHIEDFESGRKDPLFHHAPALILVSVRDGAYTPAEDAMLATQNILLAAHAMGLGTCLIGYASSAMQREPSIRKTLGIPQWEKVYSVIAVGKSEDRYLRCSGRRTVRPRVVTAEQMKRRLQKP